MLFHLCSRVSRDYNHSQEGLILLWPWCMCSLLSLCADEGEVAQCSGSTACLSVADWCAGQRGMEALDVLHLQSLPCSYTPCQFVRERERGRGAGREQCRACNNVSEQKMLSVAKLWFHLTEPLQVFITHRLTDFRPPSKYMHSTHNNTHMLKRSQYCPVTHGVCSVIFLLLMLLLTQPSLTPGLYFL